MKYCSIKVDKDIPDNDAIAATFQGNRQIFANAQVNVQYNKHELHSLDPNTYVFKLIKALQSPRFIAFLERFTGIKDLVPDVNLWGSGNKCCY